MAIYKVRDPAGNIREISGPDGASDSEIIAQAQKLFSTPSRTPDALDNPNMAAEGRLNLRPFGIDTGMQMPQGISNFFAGAGKVKSDLVRGAGQVLGITPQEEVDLSLIHI